jgi:hypothetical protein
MAAFAATADDAMRVLDTLPNVMDHVTLVAAAADRPAAAAAATSALQARRPLSVDWSE